VGGVTKTAPAKHAAPAGDAPAPAHAPKSDATKATKPTKPDKGEGAKPAAQIAATMLTRADANGDGTVDITSEAVQQLGATKAGTSAEVDRTALLRKIDASGDGTVTREEYERYVAKADANHDGALSARERRALADANVAAIRTFATTADGARSETERGFFQAGGAWYFRNEWGSVARAESVPANPRVVDAPDGFDQAAHAPTSGRGGRAAALHGAAALFDGAGIFVDQPANFSVDQAKAARAAGFTWIAMHGADADGQGNPVRREDFTPEWVAKMQSLGFKVGTWGMLGSQPLADARTASDMVNELHLDFYVADVENAHKADTGGDPARSRQFTEEFRRLQPDLPLGMSTFAAAGAPNLLGSVNDPHAGPMDYTAWNDAGAVFMPQVYPGEYGDVYSLANTMDHARRAGWDLSRVKPTLGFYRGETPETYADLAGSGTTGFSVFLGENITDSSYWSRMVAQGA
jgi:hypothetical protein